MMNTKAVFLFTSNPYLMLGCYGIKSVFIKVS